MIKLFKNGTIDELHLVYTHMESAISLKPKTLKLLPLDKGVFETTEVTSEVLEFEPTPQVVFDILASKYVKGILYGGMVEAFVSEHSARMNAMDNATTNAEKMINKLTLNYNRARQAAITQEISEIVGGLAAIE
jgi:F-type H+-transporting ATPase subunit gamma